MNMLLGVHILQLNGSMLAYRSESLSLSRMDCFTNNAVNSSNTRPQISKGNSFSGSADVAIDDYLVYNWPLNVYLNFSGAPVPQFYGQYVCRSSVGYYVRNYVHDSKLKQCIREKIKFVVLNIANSTGCDSSICITILCCTLIDNTNIELPDGSSYQLPVYNPLTIPLYFGSYPRTDLSQSSTEIVLFDVGAEVTVSVEPMYESRNAFRVDIKYATTPEAVDGDYEIRINRAGVVIARQPITIEVTRKHIDLVN